MIGNIINFPLAASFCFAFMVVPDGSAKNKITHRESCGCLQVMEIGYYWCLLHGCHGLVGLEVQS